MKLILSSILLSLPFVTSSEVVDITDENFHELTKGKSVFIKFFAPWCGHCKQLAPVWEELAKQHKDSKHVVIGKVDCTVEEDLCSDYEVKSYPTLVFGDALAPERYNEGRSLEELNDFVTESLKPYCSIYYLDLCSDKEKAAIETLKKKPIAELLAEDERVGEILAKAQDEYDTALDEMEKKFDEMVESFNQKMDELRADNDYKFIQQILYEQNHFDDETAEL